MRWRRGKWVSAEKWGWISFCFLLFAFFFQEVGKGGRAGKKRRDGEKLSGYVTSWVKTRGEEEGKALWQKIIGRNALIESKCVAYGAAVLLFMLHQLSNLFRRRKRCPRHKHILVHFFFFQPTENARAPQRGLAALSCRLFCPPLRFNIDYSSIEFRPFLRVFLALFVVPTTAEKRSSSNELLLCLPICFQTTFW